MKKILENTLTGVLVVCALLVTFSVVRREFFPPKAEPRVAREIPKWRELGQAGLAQGPQTAPVTNVEFSDFQCPFCARAHTSIKAMRERYPQQVRLVYRHFPLDRIHPYARAAGNAAECAAQQGRLSEYQDRLFSQQASIGVKDWAEFAQESGVPDLQAFRGCVAEDRFARRVSEDADAGLGIKLDSTPSILVNNTLLPGTPTTEELDAYVRAAMGDSTGLKKLALADQ